MPSFPSYFIIVYSDLASARLPRSVSLAFSLRAPNEWMMQMSALIALSARGISTTSGGRESFLALSFSFLSSFHIRYTTCLKRQGTERLVQFFESCLGVRLR